MFSSHKYFTGILGSTAMAVALAAPASAQTATNAPAREVATGTATTLTSETISAITDGTSGARAWGVLVHKSAGDQPTTLTISDTSVTTTGAKAHGIQVGANGNNADGDDASKIILGQNVSVKTSGSDSFGLHAIEGGVIEGAATIVTTGTNGFGAFAESNSAINLTGGSITTDGAYALLANNDLDTTAGVITATDVVIATEGAWAFGAVAQDGGSITLTGGSIATKGERAFGLLAEDGSTITSSAAITTTGLKAHGVQTSSDANSTGGTIHLTGGSVTTSGDDAFGLHAIGKGKIDGTVAIATSGVNGFGAFAETNSSITLTGSTITTTGANAFGLIGNNDNNGVGGIVNVTDTVVKTSGAGAHGALAKAGGTIKIKGGSVTATGKDAAALALVGTSTITLDGVTLASTDGPTALVSLGNAADVATLTFGAGSVATQNNGTLVQVNRTGAGDGLLKLTLSAGSTTKGDIIDTKTGGTQLTVETGAAYEGKITGVEDLTAQKGSTLNIAAGSVIAGDLTADGATVQFAPQGANIGGDLVLTNGAVTSGGSLVSSVFTTPLDLPPLLSDALLELLGQASSPIVVQGHGSVDQTSVLGGNLVFGGDLAISGTVTPGNSIGLIVVGGDVTLGAKSLYKVEIDGKGGSDRIAAGGTATLEGGAVKVSALDKTQSYKQAKTYTILSAEEGVTGKFGSVSTDSIFLKTALGYTENQVNLTVSIAADAFQAVAATENQFAAAAALDSLAQSGSSLALYNTIAFQTSAAEARSAFEQLAGDSYASVKTGLIESAHLTTDAITARLRDDVNAEGDAESAVWVSGFGSWIDHDANGNAGNLKTSTGGVLAGADLDLSGWRLGLAAGYSQTDLKMKRRAASADSNNWHLGIYAGKKWNALGLRAGLTHTWHSIDLSRSVAFAGFSNDLDSDYKAKTLQAFGELNYSLALGSAALEPFANVTHVRLHTNSFREDGGLAALNVKSDNTNTTFTSLGLRASAPLSVGSSAAKLRGALGWRHAFGDTTPESAQYFTGSNVFSVDGVAIAKNAVLVEAGFDIDLSKAATFGLGYAGQFGDGTSQNGVNARIKFAF